MSQLATHEPPVVSVWPPRLRRWFLWLLPVALLAGAYCYYDSFADRYLEETLAELDRTDPGWRPEELDAARQALPDEKNSALCVRDAFKLLPKDWLKGPVRVSGGPPVDNLQNLFPPYLLDEDQVAALNTRLAGTAPARAETRRLAGLPEGRLPPPPNRPGDYLLTGSGNFLQQRQVANLLRLDALLLAQEGKTDQALASCRALVNAGRSFDNEPSDWALFVRFACSNLAQETAERVLAQGAPSEASLAAWQQVLETEAARPTLLLFFREQRAAWHVYFTAIEAGQPIEAGQSLIPILSEENSPPAADSLRTIAVPHVKQVHADMLRYLTGFVEALRLAEALQQAAFIRWSLAAEAPLSFRPFMMNHAKSLDAYRRSNALLRCALVAAAVERFRRQHGRWPDTLAELCPAYLPALPTDPFGGALRYRRSVGGVIVYSVGPDGLDNSGKLDRTNPRAFGTDIGFQLWDVAHRRQPPPLIFGPPAPAPGPPMPNFVPRKIAPKVPPSGAKSTSAR